MRKGTKNTWSNKQNSPILNGLSGSSNGHWKGGAITRTDGYILVLIAGRTRKDKGKKYELLHRLIMEEKLGRKLLRTEIIHHKNGNPSDNRLENLEVLVSQSSHAKHHHPLRTRNKKGQYE